MSVDQLAWQVFLARAALYVKLLPHTVGMECSFAVWALECLLIQVHYFLADTNWFELREKLSCGRVGHVPLPEEEVVR